MLVIIDNQSKFLGDFLKILKKQKVPYKRFSHNKPVYLSNPKNVKGIILSGGPGHPHGPLNLITNFSALLQFDVPVLGICLGAEILTVGFGGKLGTLRRAKRGDDTITVLRKDPLLSGLNKKIILKKSHKYFIKKPPKDFSVLAHSRTTPVEIMKHKKRPIYAFQAHPEVLNEDGAIIIKNFFSLCDIDFK